ncbi:Helix-turn-helix domain-containing protein [Reichenbachiella faecimaris]|uniref:Helix-turn-helix domain-containing protein n=1 Tax=Reichenbachiella faecimaris TaxID=692418 RepID=A0A1W2GMV0_REIFA|nr:helix-turn-helix domain-containing protein [Reichenbachiella faecimaris]SMD37668.1 Helix-turn-helix domain-containing protein [Reichenbachiella faecimaris]
MPANVVTTEDLYFFKEELLQEIKNLFETHGTPKRKWLRSQDVQDLLCISAGTLHNLRDKGILPHSKISGVILYEYEDIVEVIRRNKV